MRIEPEMKKPVNYTFDELDDLFCAYLTIAAKFGEISKEAGVEVKTHWNTFIGAINGEKDGKSLRILMCAVCNADIKAVSNEEREEIDRIRKAVKLAKTLAVARDLMENLEREGK